MSEADNGRLLWSVDCGLWSMSVADNGRLLWSVDSGLWSMSVVTSVAHDAHRWAERPHSGRVDAEHGDPVGGAGREAHEGLLAPLVEIEDAARGVVGGERNGLRLGRVGIGVAIAEVDLPRAVHGEPCGRWVVGREHRDVALHALLLVARGRELARGAALQHQSGEHGGFLFRSGGLLGGHESGEQNDVTVATGDAVHIERVGVHGPEQGLFGHVELALGGRAPVHIGGVFGGVVVDVGLKIALRHRDVGKDGGVGVEVDEHYASGHVEFAHGAHGVIGPFHKRVVHDF
jgi:hypothetical protein